MAEPRAEAEAWQEALAKTVGKRVAQYRNQRDWTAQQLSDELRIRLGFDLKRAALGNLETGLRRTIGIAEIRALAYVLNVPPVLLELPIGEAETEVVPGVITDPWSAARWLAGEPRPGAPRAKLGEVDGSSEYEREVHRLGMYRRHDASVAEWLRIRHWMSKSESDDLSIDGKPALTRLQETEEGLYALRWGMRERALTPPPLPPELRHLDELNEQEGGTTDA